MEASICEALCLSNVWSHTAFERKETLTPCKEKQRHHRRVLLSRPALGLILGSSLSFKYSSLHPICASPILLGPPHLPLHQVQPLTFLSPNHEREDQGCPPPAQSGGGEMQGKSPFILLFMIYSITKLLDSNLWRHIPRGCAETSG